MKYCCPRHGDQGNMVGIEFDLTSLEGHQILAAKFCMICEKLIEVK